MIVIAWLEESAEIVKRGRADLGESSTTRPVLVAKSALWAAEPKEGDLEKADRWVHKEHEKCGVFVYKASMRVEVAKAAARKSMAKMFEGKVPVRA